MPPWWGSESEGETDQVHQSPIQVQLCPGAAIGQVHSLCLGWCTAVLGHSWNRSLIGLIANQEAPYSFILSRQLKVILKVLSLST